jgi:hypothetical protein
MTTYPHVKLTAFGTLGAGAGNEIWSVGMKAVVVASGAPNVPLAPNAADLAALSSGAATAWATYIATTAWAASPGGGLFSDQVCLTAVKAAAVLTTGLDDPTLSSDITDVPANTRGKVVSDDADGWPGQVPFQVALCVTLKGDTYARKGAAYGRFYLPVPNLHVVSALVAPTRLLSGRMWPSSVAIHAAHVKILLDAVNAVAVSAGRDAYVANISQSTGSAGLRFQKVSTIVIDDRPDTIRRRSNKLGGHNKVPATLA